MYHTHRTQCEVKKAGQSNVKQCKISILYKNITKQITSIFTRQNIFIF